MDNVIQMLPTLEAHPGVQDEIRRLSTAQLKAMWDDPDRYGNFCDEIYFEMQARGEGRYVAV